MSLLIEALKKTDKAEADSGYQFVPKASVTKSKVSSSFMIVKAVVAMLLVIVCVASAVFFYFSRHKVPSKTAAVVAVKPVAATIPAAAPSIKLINKPYEDALVYIESENYQAAIALLKDESLIEPTHGKSLVALAKSYLALGQVREAQAVARAGAEKNTPAREQLIGLLAQTQYLEKDYQQALNTLTTASPSLQADPAYYALMAKTYIKLNQPEPAILLFKQLVTYNPKEVAWWVGLALSYQEGGNLSAASAAYSKAVKLNVDPQVALFLEHQRRLILGAEEMQ